MGTNSFTNDENNIFLLNDDNISLYYDLLTNKSNSEEDEEHNIDNIKNVFLEEKLTKKPKSKISGGEVLKFPVIFEWDNGGFALRDIENDRIIMPGQILKND